MKVKAIHQGFYGNVLRHPEDEFSIKGEEDFAKDWMVKMSDAKKGKKGDPEFVNNHLEPTMTEDELADAAPDGVTRGEAFAHDHNKMEDQPGFVPDGNVADDVDGKKTRATKKKASK